MLDLVIRGGTIVDGSGRERRTGEIGIKDGKIAEIGTVVGPARATVDVEGAVVAPGFIDIHTHYDAQVFWDRTLTPSCLHGVTTAIAGNCGFSIAPLASASADFMMRMLARVEGMPLESLVDGVPWNWSTTADYLEQVDQDLGINLGFLVGHSALRRHVMGPDASERLASTTEVDAMRALLEDGLRAGALGFSSSLGWAHLDWDGQPVPSRSSGRDELLALAATCADFVGTSLEFIPGDRAGLSDDQANLMAELSAVASRPLNWNVLRVTADTMDEAWSALRAGTVARELGGRVVALTMPIPSRARFSFKSGIAIEALPGWGETMALPLAERLTALRTPEVRARLATSSFDPQNDARLADWGAKVIAQTFTAGLEHYQGRVVADLAAERNTSALDALLDVACADSLQTTFSHHQKMPDRAYWEANAAVWRDGRAVIGASDAGAHIDLMATHDYAVYILEHAVREHGVVSLEEAVHLLTDVPARLYGLTGRGRLEVGAFADLVVFDEQTVGSGELETRFDLPGGAGRLYSEPVGVHGVYVAGEPLVIDGKVTDRRPGRVLRSGTDTSSPGLSSF